MKTNTYIIDYISSIDKSSTTMVEAENEHEAENKVRKRLGRACYRIVSIREYQVRRRSN